ncbi:hypothetical protein UlMin_037471 [Ulmus minor]
MEKYLVSSSSKPCPNQPTTENEPSPNPSQIEPTVEIIFPESVIDLESQQPLKSPKKEIPETESVKRKAVKKSTVWEHFTNLKVGKNQEPRASCNYCGKSYASDTRRVGTSSMWGHLNNQCPKYPLRVLDKKQKLLSFEATNELSGALKAVIFNQNDCRDALCRMVVIDELPFRFVGGFGFRSFCAVLQSRFVIPSRMTIARDVVRLYNSEMEKLKKELTMDGQRVFSQLIVGHQINKFLTCV